jgi:hypothetical protein
MADVHLGRYKVIAIVEHVDHVGWLNAIATLSSVVAQLV